MTEEQRESSFDALAKGMASGTVSRGKALRLMGAALVGGTLAAIPGIALAKGPPLRPNGRKCRQNSQCVSNNCQDGVCQAVAGPTPTGVTVRCLCRRADETQYEPTTCWQDNLQCPFDSGEVQCRGFCGSDRLINWSCQTTDYCYA